MNRRRLLSGVALPALLAFGGCLGGGTDGSSGTETSGSADDETNGTPEDDGKGETPHISDRFDCSEAHRPETDVEAGVEHEVEFSDETVVYESVGSTGYPDPPAEFDGDPVRTFVADYERAYQRHEYLTTHGDRLVEFDARIEETELFDFRDGIATARVDFSIHFAAVSGEKVVMTEPVGEAAAYAVDETGIVRTAAEYRDHVEGPVREHTPGPLEEGSLLHCF